jgi:hypothetical protein
MQMNADHDIVNSELTEFSQVIAATSAYGYTYDNCNEIFKGLAKTAFEASRHVLESVDKFLKQTNPDAQSDLYDAIGRIVLMEGSIKDKENLTNIINEAVMKVFPDRPTVKMAWLSDKPAQIVRGYAMTYFGQLVNDELLKKEKDGKMARFSITEKGIELLQKCGAI